MTNEQIEAVAKALAEHEGDPWGPEYAASWRHWHAVARAAIEAYEAVKKEDDDASYTRRGDDWEHSMTDSMTQRIARMLCQWTIDGYEDEEAAKTVTPDSTLGGDGKTFLWWEHIGEAKQLFAAMREPTEAMIAAGVHHDNMGDMAGRWAAMIDAAIAESDPRGRFDFPDRASHQRRQWHECGGRRTMRGGIRMSTTYEDNDGVWWVDVMLVETDAGDEFDFGSLGDDGTLDRIIGQLRDLRERIPEESRAKASCRISAQGGCEWNAEPVLEILYSRRATAEENAERQAYERQSAMKVAAEANRREEQARGLFARLKAKYEGGK